MKYSMQVSICVKFHIRLNLTMTGYNPQILLRSFSKGKPEKIRT